MVDSRYQVDYELESDGDERVLQALERREFRDPAQFLLRQRVAHLALVRGFDQLLSLDAIAVDPLPHQIDTARKVLRRFRGRALLGDEVGLGKTIEAALILKEYLLRGLVRKALILTPPALVSQWREELATKFGLEFVTNESPEFRALGTDAWSRFDLVLASLSLARTGDHARAILGQRYDLVVVDEAHHLKNRSSVSWHFVNQLDRKFILLLSATPVQNNLEELFNLITLLKPGQLRTVQAFKKEFVTRGDPRLPRNRARLQELLSDVMIRNTRGQVALQLPRRHATTVRLSLSSDERELYDAVSGFVRAEHPSAGEHGRGMNRFALETLQMEIGSSSFAAAPTLRTLARGANRDPRQTHELERLAALASAIKRNAKADALMKLLAASSEKAIVFTKYLETLRYLARTLNDAGMSTAVYHGGLDTAEKDACIASFERDRRVLLCTEAAGEGRNLQFCNTMINYDLPWNPMRIEQRVGRIHRIGQDREVFIYNLSADRTVEDYILWLLDAKINMFELVIGEMDMILGNLADEGDFTDVVSEIWLRSNDHSEVERDIQRFGERLVEAKNAYLKTRDYDNLVFGQDYEVEG
ncbi:MAG: DEAD/DEAH box helicase [Chloroflexota bacterium]